MSGSRGRPRDWGLRRSPVQAAKTPCTLSVFPFRSLHPLGSLAWLPSAGPSTQARVVSGVRALPLGPEQLATGPNPEPPLGLGDGGLETGKAPRGRVIIKNDVARS